MDKEKKLEKRKTRRQTRIFVTSEQVLPKPDEFDLPGISKIFLSNITQRVIGCVVGENISTENRWKYVKKEIIQDNIELHEESSEFLPLKDAILNCEDEELLFGLAKDSEAETHQFYVCLSKNVKFEVLKVIEKQQEELEEKLRNAVKKTVGVWHSLGSEQEIDECNIYSLRPLIEVEVESACPMEDTRVCFKMRMAEGARDGYVEILPSRFPYKNISRKRVDTGVQATPATTCTEAQTSYKYPMNISTQYEYKYKECNLNEEIKTHCNTFVHLAEEKLTEMINFNCHINIYSNDYEKLANKETIIASSELDPEEIFSFSDIKTCEKNMITSVSWHPELPGTMAISYAPTTYNNMKLVSGKQNNQRDPERQQATPVLIWSFADYLKPKLYLKTDKCVSSVQFNPVNPNIIVGGCTNGQIELWDITGRLEKVDSQEVLTAKEISNRFAMQSMMGWMKDTHDIAIVHPTAISEYESSHKHTITYMKFFPSNIRINIRGQFENIIDGEDNQIETANQFLTASLDGSIYIWNITLKIADIEKLHAKAQRKTRRLKELPEALTQNVSPYRSFGNNFKPIYKLIINTSLGLIFPISSASIPKLKVFYQPTRKSIEANVASDERYEYDRIVTNGLSSRTYYLSSMTGQIWQIHWEGYDFDTGMSMNVEKAEVSERFLNIHDGPISRCVANQVLNEILLTIGGAVFAVWNVNYKSKPLFWKKCKFSRYTNGTWLTKKPAAVILLRTDGVLELWNLAQNIRNYTVRSVVSGDALLRVSNSSTKFMIRKNTIGIADNTGVMRILATPDLHNQTNSPGIVQFTKLVERELKRKKYLDKWIKFWKLKNQNETAKNLQKKDDIMMENVANEAGVEEDENNKEKNTPQLHEMWVNRQQEIMYETMLERKKLNLKELEKYRKPLKIMSDEKNSREKKKENMIQTKDKIFEHAKGTVLESSDIKRDSEIYGQLEARRSLLFNYDELEDEYLAYIKQNPFNMRFDWNQTVNEIRNKKYRIKRQIFPERFLRADLNFLKKVDEGINDVQLYSSEIEEKLEVIGSRTST